MRIPGQTPPPRPTPAEIRDAQNATADAGEINAVRLDTAAILEDLDRDGAAIIGERYDASGKRKTVAHMADPRREHGEIIHMSGRPEGHQQAAVMLCPYCQREHIEEMPPDIPTGRKPRPAAAALRPCPPCRDAATAMIAAVFNPAAILDMIKQEAEKTGQPTADDIRAAAQAQEPQNYTIN